ncbi:MAG TPA: hypothetical protein VJR02_15690 [Pyrinomonadaceae bacterium]|nr:hypothetical protein [Pyrinomonadaceae bacterium]
MDVAESTLHSFIVKIWIDEQDGKSGRRVWRGYVTHVPSGAQRYLKCLSDIEDFIKEYLDEDEIQSNSRSLVCEWIRRVTTKPTREK